VVSFDDRQVALDALHHLGWRAARPVGDAMVSVSRDGDRPGDRGIRSDGQTADESAGREVTGPFGPRHPGGDGSG
jgi:alkylated DNA nucleotide flippase Atl1